MAEGHPPGLPAELLGLGSVAAARLTGDGCLIEANEGFRRLLPPELGCRAEGSQMAAVFIQPSLRTLLATPPDGDGYCHRGLLTLGDPRGRTRTLTGTLRRLPGEGGLLLVAEPDIEDLERVYESSLSLTRELTEMQRELSRANRRIRDASMTDPLTGVANRRRLEEVLLAEVDRAERHAHPLSVVMCDLDHFKRLNDELGHEAGDQALTAVAGLLCEDTRGCDLVARYGGEEFTLVLPESATAEAVSLSERLRKRISEAALLDGRWRITVSFGVAERLSGEDAKATLRRADQALYRAKQQGRDTVCVASVEQG